MPDISQTMEAFQDTPLINGTAYPKLDVQPAGLPFPHPERRQRPDVEPAAVHGQPDRQRASPSPTAAAATPRLPMVTITARPRRYHRHRRHGRGDHRPRPPASITGITIITVGSGYTLPPTSPSPRRTVGGTSPPPRRRSTPGHTEVGMVPASRRGVPSRRAWTVQTTRPAWATSWTAAIGGVPDPDDRPVDDPDRHRGRLPAVPGRLAQHPDRLRAEPEATSSSERQGAHPSPGTCRARRRHRRLLAVRRQDPDPLQRCSGAGPGRRLPLRLLHRRPGQTATGGAPRPSPATAPTPAPSCSSTWRPRLRRRPSTQPASRRSSPQPPATRRLRAQPGRRSSSRRRPTTTLLQRRSSRLGTNTYVAHRQSTSMTFNPIDPQRRPSRHPGDHELQAQGDPGALRHLGRMNATLGVEMPFTTGNTQTTIPYGYIDPPTEIIHRRRDPDLEDHPQRRRHPPRPLPPVQRAGDQPRRLGWRGQAARRQRDGLEGNRADEPAGRHHRGDAAEQAERCLRGARQRAACSTRRMPPGSTMGFRISTRSLATPVTVTNELVRLRLGVRLALPHPRPRREGHDARRWSSMWARALPTASLLSGLIDTSSVAQLTWTDPTAVNAPATLGNPQNEIGYRIERALIGANGLPGGFMSSLVSPWPIPPATPIPPSTPASRMPTGLPPTTRPAKPSPTS